MRYLSLLSVNWQSSPFEQIRTQVPLETSIKTRCMLGGLMIASSSPFPSSIVDHVRVTFSHSLVVIIYGNRYANMRVLDSNLYHLDNDNVVYANKI